MSDKQTYCPDALEQYNVEVRATTTLYQFREGKVELDVLFLTPALLKDIELLSLPITFIEFTVRNLDSKPHTVEIYYDNSADPTVNKESEEVTWEKHR